MVIFTAVASFDLIVIQKIKIFANNKYKILNINIICSPSTWFNSINKKTKINIKNRL
jgi:hypothetical protein